MIKTSHVQIFFLFFSIMERIRKGSDLPKEKVGVTEHPTKIFADQVTAKVISSIFCNGNRTEWSPIQSVIIRVITKSDDRAAGVRFVFHEYDYRLNWTIQSPIIN